MGKILLIAFSLTFLASCVPVTKNTIPSIPPPEIFGTLSPATAWLDCLSKELYSYNHYPVKIALASISNEFALHVSKSLQLPSRMNAFVENSLDRINNVFIFFEGNELLGTPGLKIDIHNLQGASDTLTRDAIVSDRTSPDFVIAGSLYMAQETKSAGGNIEIMNLGLRGEVKAFDISLQLKALDAKNRRKIVLKSLTVRLYSAEHGGSAFFVTGGDDDFLTTAAISGIQAPSVITSLQFLSDYIVAALMRDLSTAIFGQSFSMCDKEIIGRDKSKTPNQENLSFKQRPLNVSLFKNDNGLICASIKKKEGAYLNPNDQVTVVWRQYSSDISLNIPVGPALYDQVNAAVLTNTTVCLPKTKIYSHSKAFELEVIDEKTGMVIGLGAL